MKTTTIRAAIAAALTIAASATMPFASFAEKPYDAVVEYLEAPVGTGGVPYIDTGLKPADDMGVYMRAMPLRESADTTVCGAMATVTVDNKNVDWRWYMGFISKKYGYLSWGTDNPGTRFSYSPNTIYDILFNHFNSRNRRVEKVGGGYTFDLPITDAWPSGANQNIYLFAYNNNGTAGNTGNARIYSAQFTQDDTIVMNLIPVIKDGVGYMYDTVNDQLLGKVEGSSSAEFVCGRSIIETSKTLDADEDWTNLGQLLISSGVTIDLNGHTLRIVGADGEGTITDNSSGDPGLLRVTAPSSVVTPVTVTTSGNMTIFRSRKPYDAQVEYLEAPPGGSGNEVSWIDTGLYPGNDKGVFLRATPLRTTDSTACGVQCYHPAVPEGQTKSKNFFKWYFGFNNAKVAGIYLAWDTDVPKDDADHRPQFSVGSTYDIYFNHLNDRCRRVVGVGNATDFSLDITRTWPSTAATNTIYLFAYNNNGASVGNTGNVRIHSAQFTQGNNVVMDLIPVRKDGVGYMYDKVSERLLGKVESELPAFTYENDAVDEAYIEGNVRLEADADWTSRGILRMDEFAMIDLNGHSLTIAGAYGTGTITNSSATLGEVHFVIPDRNVQTCSLAILGNVKVFKEGGGTLSLSRAGQTFTGGVVVDGGTAKADASCPENGSYWGASNGTITVAANATFDVHGNHHFYRKNFILDGGTLANTVNMGNSKDNDNIGIGNVTLVADSYLVVSNATHTYFSLSGATPAEKIDLGGNTLTVSTIFGNLIHFSQSIENGTMDFVKITGGGDGGYLYVFTGETAGSPTVNIDMKDSALQIDGALSVSNYTARYTGGYNRGASAIKVYGTFTPAAVTSNGIDCFHGCEMQGGSFIDLSAKSAGWENVAGWGDSNADGNKTITFANEATVGILLGTRNVKSGEKIIDWSSAVPANRDGLEFFGQFTDGRRIMLKVKDDGLYAPNNGFIIIVK